MSPLLSLEAQEFIAKAKVVELPGAASLHAFQALLMVWLAGDELAIAEVV